ncbi:unnamed protein product [Dibothriocephalus latus]|uniref:Uncharacterized protein n=1 Tax=Dibothriocephalus latus TaxID=60516 RepID=A0A3P6QXD5_DIBLA|nr:unnamed protein product [Dibothriocephalus latus]
MCISGMGDKFAVINDVPSDEDNMMDAVEESGTKLSRKRSRKVAEDTDADVACPSSPSAKKPKRRRSEH